MKKKLWKEGQPPCIRQPAFAGYGNVEETRPVQVDCALGINPVENLYGTTTVTFPAQLFRTYPAGGAHGHTQLWPLVTSRFPLVKQEEIAFSAGSQGSLSNLSRILGGSLVTIQCVLPTFVPVLLEFSSTGAVLDPLHLSEPEYTISVDALIQRLNNKTTLLYLDNPNNPTGQVLPLQDIRRLAEACKENGTLLIIDEAYGDFVDDANSALNLELENIVCMRSFSKGCGLAGLRLGYVVIKDRELRQCYREIGLHFSSSAAAAVIAQKLLPLLDLHDMRNKVTLLKQRLSVFIGNYPDFFITATHPGTPILLLGWHRKENLYDALMNAGIQTEPSQFFGMKHGNCVRLRCPATEQFDLFCHLFDTTFKQ